MMFLLYKGGIKTGRFTVGSVYLAHSALENSGSSSRVNFKIKDDYNAELVLKYESQFFQELEGVHVCCVKACGAMQEGDILYAKQADDDFFNIEGVGFMRQSNFEILDNANFRVGSYVHLPETGNWRPIDKIDGSTITVGEFTFNPTDLRLSVSDNTVLDSPIKQCEAQGDNLTLGSDYLVVRETIESIEVKNDLGILQVYDKQVFTKKQA